MFIVNIEDFNIDFLYKCNYEDSKYLQDNGFCLLGIDQYNNYCFAKTKELLKFLGKDGEN